MGSINVFNIKKIKEEYGFTDYVETGTGIGGCLDYVMQFNFDNYWRNITERVQSEGKFRSFKIISRLSE